MDIGKVPGLRRLVLIKRMFWNMLVEVDARTRESASASDAIAQDTAALMEGMEHSITSQKALSQRAASVDSELQVLKEAIDGYDRRSADRLDALRERLEGQLDSLALQNAEDLVKLEALKEILDSYDRRSADRLDLLRERLEVVLLPDAKAAEAHAALVELLANSATGLVWRLVTPTTVSETLGADDAELHLCAYLAAFVADRHAIDVGAHRGRYTQALLDQGITVVAVEPEPSLAAELRLMFEGMEGAIVREAAAAESHGSAPLYLAEDLSSTQLLGDSTLFSSLVPRSRVAGLRFNRGPQVATLTVDEIRADLGWPARIGFLKLDVEGTELSVLDGLGETRPEVLMCEYWGPDHVIVGDHPAVGVAPLIERLVPSGFRHWVTIIHGDNDVGFAVNSREVPPGSWGNILFFEERDTFMAAVRWCSSSLREHIRTIGGA